MALSTESRFFGLDLSQLKTDILKAWKKAPQWPPLSWLRPEQALTLVRAHVGPELVWESGALATGIKKTPAFWAVELPETMVLRKTMRLPPLDSADCASAAELEVQAISPFAEADLLWGYAELARSKTAVTVQLVLASRQLVEPYLQSKIAERQQASGNTQVLAPELWVLQADRRPLVIRGFGEQARIQAGRKKLLLNVLGVGLSLLLLAGIALTPTAQLRLRAVEATHAYEAMAIKTTDVVAKREQLMQSADKVAVVAELLAERIDGVKVLSMLTRVLPDDTALQSARIQGSKVTITGLTENASNLMQKLSNEEGVKDVKAPSAATRLGGNINKESFTIELALDTKKFGPTVKVDEPVAPKTAEPDESAAATPQNGSDQPVGTPPPAAASEAAKPATVAEPAAQGASVGGSRPSASVGGSKPSASVGGSRPSVGGSRPPRPAKPVQEQEGQQ